MVVTDSILLTSAVEFCFYLWKENGEHETYAIAKLNTEQEG